MTLDPSEQTTTQLLDEIKTKSEALDEIECKCEAEAPYLLLLIHGLPGTGKTEALKRLKELASDQDGEYKFAFRDMSSNRQHDDSERRLAERLTDIERTVMDEDENDILDATLERTDPDLLELILDAQVKWISDLLWKSKYVVEELPKGPTNILVCNWDPWLSYLTFEAAEALIGSQHQVSVSPYKRNWIERFNPDRLLNSKDPTSKPFKDYFVQPLVEKRVVHAYCGLPYLAPNLYLIDKDEKDRRNTHLREQTDEGNVEIISTLFDTIRCNAIKLFDRRVRSGFIC